MVSGSRQSSPRRSTRGLLSLIGLLALATNLLYFKTIRNFDAPDTPTYITPAFNLLQGHGFSDSLGRPETFRTPGYPLLILPFLWAGVSLEYLVLFQHLLQVLLVIGTTAAVFQISGSRKQAWLAGILFSIDLPTLESTNLVLSETLFTICFGIALWLIWSGSRAADQSHIARIALSGLLAGASVLIRPISLYFIFPAIVYLLLAGSRFRFLRVLVFTAAFACFPFLWATRNYHQTDHFTISSTAGLEMLCCRAAGVLALDDPGAFNDNLTRRRAQLEGAACADLKALYGKDCTEIPVALKSDFFMHRAREIMLQHPVALVRLALRGAVLMWLDGGTSGFQGITGINPHTALRILLIYTVPALGFAFIGLWRLWKSNRQLCYLVFLTLLYFVVVSSGGDTYSRHRVPVTPLYIMLIAAGIDFAFGAKALEHAGNHQSPAPEQN